MTLPKLYTKYQIPIFASGLLQFWGQLFLTLVTFDIVLTHVLSPALLTEPNMTTFGIAPCLNSDDEP